MTWQAFSDNVAAGECRHWDTGHRGAGRFAMARGKGPKAEDEGMSREQKIAKYEQFIEERLKTDLQHVMTERNKINEELKSYRDLEKSIRLLQVNDLTSMRSMVNLGSEVYAQAQIDDTSHLFVDIGLGFHVEFTLQEALNFIDLKQKSLTAKVDAYTSQIADIKSQIKLFCEGIRELMRLPFEDHSARKPKVGSFGDRD
ncbi:hypothetical protein CBR_g48697 [Chara braunii]|uniref:Uncharacterized protein n=1 Tax=Chara braunii TaxID=69332 RepID=A0A388K4G4_CHABU|nr:hypothetical protein CBR_g48697 [Chara braunii]|eukprot:GBG64948.1 hypothetical protein CBR_g48697 [Chara braunii]